MRDVVLKAFKNSVNKKLGDTIGYACEVRLADIPRLSTGSLSLDFALGGGVPVGRPVIFRGDESSGKTTNALRVAGLAQRLCANCFREAKDFHVVEVVDEISGEVEYRAEAVCDCYSAGIFKPVPYADEYSSREKGTMRQVEVEVEDKDGKKKKKKTTAYADRLERYKSNSYEEFRVAFFDFEGSLDIAWAKQVGVDTRLLLVVTPATAEEGIDIYDELLKTGSVDLFILDSIAAMTPSIEVDESAEKDQMGIQARLVNKFVRKVTSTVNDCYRDYGRMITQIWINQERETMSSGWGPSSVMPAGKGQKFGCSVIVKFWASKWEKESFDSDLKKEFQLEVGKEVRINFKIIKNKTATAQVSGGYILRVVGSNRGHVDEFKYVLDQATKHGLFRSDGDGAKKKWFVGNEEFSTKGSALACIENHETFRAMKKALLKKMLTGLSLG